MQLGLFGGWPSMLEALIEAVGVGGGGAGDDRQRGGRKLLEARRTRRGHHGTGGRALSGAHFAEVPDATPG